MLSAFTARPIVELRARDKSKIESILAYGDRLLVGLNTGSLRVYRVNEIPEDKGEGNGTATATPDEGTVTNPAPKPVDLLREVEKFSTRSIEQLARIKEANVLISLSNYYVSIYDLQTYTLQEQLVKTKNATTFAVTSNIVKDSASGILEIISRLAVAVKRRLLLWSWHEAELESNVVEITLAESIRTLTWTSATKIICGMNSGYVIVDVLTQEIEDIVGPGAIGGAAGAQGGRFGSVGSTTLQPPSKGILEVRNPETLSLLQTITLPNASQMHFPPPNVSLAHAGKGFHVVSDRCIWGMGTTDYDTQVDELVEKGLYDEAISLLNMLEDALLRNKEERLRETKILKAQRLFDQRKYRDAIDIFLAEDVQAPPERVIRLYPPVIAGELSTFEEKSSEDEDAHENSEEANGDGAADDKQENTDPAKPAAISKLLKGHKKNASDAGSIRSFMKFDNNDGSDTSSVRPKQPEDSALEGKDLVNAALELNSFLVDARNRMKRWLDAETGKLVPQNTTGNGQNGRQGPSEASFESFLVAPASDAEKDLRYLEHVINELNDLNPEFHNDLVSAYLKDLKERNDRDSEDWKDLMNDPGFYEAQAVVLSNLGQHKQALVIYVFKIKDFQKAEEYCNYVYLQSDPSTVQSTQASTTDSDDSVPSIYHTLLSLYLTPPPPHEPNWPPALELLSKHGSRLPASSTMNLIPDTLPISELESYFRGRIRSVNSVVNEVRIVAGLRKTEVVSAQASLLLGDGKPGGKGGRNRGVYVEKDRVCGVCHKRLGRSVIAVLPDNEVVHYGCLNRADKRPIGGGMESLRSPPRRS
ncbi:putative Vam6/Vps39-like protein [Glarea lozoyensis 74030]|uniref:Putative Vam6/Vps39-like protein n=1 Tax=Glarea lozoyensis (strain ATCC 74030 / MF5533) TaxID=1104152 RepID=H0ET76_GLAL7|nr:putative Vam6/Vps39-like protein [Glarea lozoyensis 74030]